MKIKLDGIHLDKQKLGHPTITNPHHAPLWLDVDVVVIDCEYHVSIVFAYISTPRIRFWESITGWRWKEVSEGVLMDKRTQRVSEVRFDLLITSGYGALVQELHGVAHSVKSNIWSNSGNAIMVSKAISMNRTKIADSIWKEVCKSH